MGRAPAILEDDGTALDSCRIPGLVNYPITNWKIPIFYGKTHYFDWAIFNSYVSLPEGNFRRLSRSIKTCSIWPRFDTRTRKTRKTIGIRTRHWWSDLADAGKGNTPGLLECNYSTTLSYLHIWLTYCCACKYVHVIMYRICICICMIWRCIYVKYT